VEKKNRFLKYRLFASPIDVAPYLKRLVFDEISPLVLTSATLTVSDSFSYLKERLGIEDVEEEIIPSPFDFTKQALLYAPGQLPDPAYQEKEYVEAISSQVESLVKVTEGRTFVLFTSFRTLDQVFEILKDKLSGFRLLKHGDIPRWQLLETFKKKKKAVLFGTATFWQGVDVPGEALESVIITRLPFAVPNHPLIEARLESLAERGHNPFMNYQVPQAVLLFRQGFGRLIRHRKDLGIVSVLDPRVKTRRYGQLFLRSLPNCRQVLNIDDLSRAYADLKS
jgi:ATP-dependent DNA helicase DinG